MEGYMQVLLNTQTDGDTDNCVDTQMQLNMIGKLDALQLEH